MEFKKYMKNVDVAKAVKVAGFGIAGIVVLAVIVSIGQNLFGRSNGFMSMPQMSVAPSADYYDYGKEYSSNSSMGMGGATLSARNVMPVPQVPGTTGNTAEEFEVTDYNAQIETRDLEETCGAITDLKALSYVIFENSNSYDRGCGYTFKVEKARVGEILAKIEALDPKTLSENTYTIKRQVDDFTSQEEILKNKLESIDQTLAGATTAYDEITRLASRTQDVATLAKIIDSKIQVIERLTQERIAVSEQLDRLARAKSEQLDRLEYTYFSVNVSENKYIDTQDLKDSWKATLRQFVQTLNRIAQDITVNLVVFLFFVLQVAIYLAVVLLVAKYGWKWARKIWKK